MSRNLNDAVTDPNTHWADNFLYSIIMKKPDT